MLNFTDSLAIIRQHRDALVDFTQRIVATPSLSGEEGNVAAIIAAEMEQLGFDDVWTDEVGNLIGKINGSGGPTIMLNGHMDVVDPGPPAGWPHPAYSGQIVDGQLWGRGSVDMKGPLAAMIYGAACFKRMDLSPAGELFMTVVVSEEISGLGADFLMRDFSADAAIVGEPSQNELRIGHRGRMELQVKFKGKSAHASAPHLGINPHFAAAEFLQKLDQLTLDCDATLGQSTIAPTLYNTDQVSANVIPSEVVVYLDWRNVPSETPEHAIAEIRKLAGDCDVAVTRQMRKTYTGLDRDFESIFPPFATDKDHAIVKAVSPIIATATEKPVEPKVWGFATDGGHISAAGVPTIGIGPGDDSLAHTNQERISLDDLELGAAIYGPIVCAMMDAIQS